MGFKSTKDRFASIKKKLNEERTKPKGGGDYASDLFFKPQAVKGEPKTKFRIRILDLEDESSVGLPWININYHMFERQGDSKYCKCIDPRTFDKNAANPIADLASELFNTGNELDNAQAKKLYRKPRYMLKVLVKEAPENQSDLVGKILIYEASKTIYDKLVDEIEETDEDEASFWDAFEGKDFMLVMKTKSDWPDYSDSKFVGSGKPISDDEDEMQKIYDAAVALKVKDTVLKRDPIKTEAELNELLRGGMKKASGSTTRDTGAQDLVTGDEVDADDVDFGDDDEDTTTESVKEEAPAKKEESDDDMDFDDVDFNDEDFDI